MFLLGNRGWIFANCQSRKSRAHHLALRPCLVLQGAAEGHGAKPSRRIPRPLLACSERNQYGNADTQSIARLAEAREERKVHKLADLAFPMDLCWKCHQTIWRTTRAALLHCDAKDRNTCLEQVVVGSSRLDCVRHGWVEPC